MQIEENKPMDILGNARSGAQDHIILYHGSPCRDLIPTFGKGKDYHDYGKGFYLSPSPELAKEWSVGQPTRNEGWLHTYRLDLNGLTVLNFEAIEKYRALEWVTEILRHRRPDTDRARYGREYCDLLFRLFPRNSDDYDVICGWRADDSYFKIAFDLLSDGLALCPLEDALRLGGLGIQYCCKSEKAYKALHPIGLPQPVPISKYRRLYHRRDDDARRAFDTLKASQANKLRGGNVFMRDLYLKYGGDT